MYKGTKKDGKGGRHRKRLPKKEFERKKLESKSKDSCVKSPYFWLHPHADEEDVYVKIRRGDDVITYCASNLSTNGKDSIICGGCKKIIIDKDGEKCCEHVENCCYDCEFRWWCHDCCFTYRRTPDDDQPYRTCGMTLMNKLLHPYDRSGRYGDLSVVAIHCLRQHFKKDMKYKYNVSSLRGKSMVISEILPLPATRMRVRARYTAASGAVWT